MEPLRDQLARFLVAPLRARLGGRLVAVVAFGSVLEFLDAVDPPLLANVNVLVVVDEVDLALTDLLRGVLLSRDLEGVEVTLIARGELPRLAEVFPLEVHELRAGYQVLEGEDPLAGLEPSDRNLGHQLAYELASKRQALLGLLVTRGATHADTGRQLLSMAGAFACLGRQLLRLRGETVGRSLEDLLAALSEHAGLSERGAEAVRDLQATREDRRRPARGEKRTLLEAFLEAWEALTSLAAGPRREVGSQATLPFDGVDAADVGDE